MKKVTLEITEVEGKLYYQIFKDGVGVCGTYVFENATNDLIDLKFEFANQEKSE